MGLLVCPLAEAFGRDFDGFLAGNFEGGGAVEAGGEQFLDDGFNADDAVHQGDEAHAAAELDAAFRQPLFWHFFPVKMFDTAGESSRELQWIAAAESGVAGVEVDADRLLVPKRVEDARHSVHRVGENAVRFEQKLDAKGFRPADRLMEFFADAEEALVIGEAMAELRL